MQKKSNTAMGLIIILLLFTGGCSYFISMIEWDAPFGLNEKEYKFDFDKYQDDFQTIVDVVLEHKKEVMEITKNDTVHRIEVNKKNGKYTIDTSSYGGNDKKTWRLDKKEQESFRRVDELAKKIGDGLRRIYIKHNYIEIVMEISNFSIVYSTEWYGPYNFNSISTDKYYKYKTKKIKGHWYQAKSIYDQTKP